MRQRTRIGHSNSKPSWGKSQQQQSSGCTRWKVQPTQWTLISTWKRRSERQWHSTFAQGPELASGTDLEHDDPGDSTATGARTAGRRPALQGQAHAQQRQKQMKEKVTGDIRWIATDGWTMDNGGVFVGARHRVLADSLRSSSYMDGIDLA
eukprot:4200137-Amphidinium_carterae.1